MRTFLLSILLTGALTLSSGLMAAPRLGAGPLDAARLTAGDAPVLLVQQRQFRGGSVSRGVRIRPRVKRPRIRLRRVPAAGPSRVIRSGSGILRDRYNRAVRTRGNEGKRDIGAGQAVISAQSHVPGTVLGVRRNGAVYNVKILDRNRVRIIRVNAATGQVMR